MAGPLKTHREGHIRGPDQGPPNYRSLQNHSNLCDGDRGVGPGVGLTLCYINSRAAVRLHRLDHRNPVFCRLYPDQQDGPVAAVDLPPLPPHPPVRNYTDPAAATWPSSERAANIQLA